MPNTISLVGLSDIGRARSRNEDSLALSPSSAIAVVADGMGGHPSGDVASRIAATQATRMLEERLGSSSSPDEEPRSHMRAAMMESVMAAHRAIRAACGEDELLEGMGTTLTSMALDRDRKRYTLGHVGDSRAYLFRAGVLSQLTTDDTCVQARVDASELTPEQARHHPYSHVLTQCVGLEDEPAPHILDGVAAVDDVYLLCSDGLVGMLEDADIVSVMRERLGDAPSAANLEDTAQALVAAANEAGGNDNITVVLVLVG